MTFDGRGTHGPRSPGPLIVAVGSRPPKASASSSSSAMRAGTAMGSAGMRPPLTTAMS